MTPPLPSAISVHDKMSRTQSSYQFCPLLLALSLSKGIKESGLGGELEKSWGLEKPRTDTGLRTYRFGRSLAADFVHPSSANRTLSFHRFLPVFHCHGLRVGIFSLCSAFYTVKTCHLRSHPLSQNLEIISHPPR